MHLISQLRRYGSERGFEPSGRMFGLPPNRPVFWWEPGWYIGVYGGIAAFLIAEHYKDEKSPTERAIEEARINFQKRGDNLGWPLPDNYTK